MLALEITLLIIATILIAAFFSPTNWTIEAAIEIQKPKKEVYDYLKILKNSEKYNKWVMTDPTMRKAFKGTDGTVGFVYSWESENKQVGKGEQEIKNLTDGARIDYEIRFIKPFTGTSTSSLVLESVSDKLTRVKWSFSSSNNYLMKIMHVLFNLKKVLLKDLQASLGHLKSILDN